MNHFLRYAWFGLVVRPLVLLAMGVNVRHRERLAMAGPAILVANHNSHLDTMVLMTLLPFRQFKTTRPVAAMDYFLKNRLLAWFATRVIGIVPLRRDGGGTREDPLAGCTDALAQGSSLILFPEGSRGEPERLATFKNGIAHLVKRHPTVPVVPVFLHGLGKALPRGECIFVPFFCDAAVGNPLIWSGSRSGFMQLLDSAMQELAAEIDARPWE